MVWGSCGKILRDELQRLQNRAVRVLTNSNYDADASILLNDLRWQNLEFIRQWQRINIWIALRLITCLQNLYYAVIHLIPITLDILKMGLWVLSLDLGKKEILGRVVQSWVKSTKVSSEQWSRRSSCITDISITTYEWRDCRVSARFKFRFESLKSISASNSFCLQVGDWKL